MFELPLDVPENLVAELAGVAVNSSVHFGLLFGDCVYEAVAVQSPPLLFQVCLESRQLNFGKENLSAIGTPPNLFILGMDELTESFAGWTRSVNPLEYFYHYKVSFCG